ncbi:DUF1489 domain-containing protein [Methylobacterium sp. NEAU 140]|uniref:DUF1489 family protein n=1 Tax=Methylobacterium sp. NEAU 140 TaxID=3064945 RepID=UPI002734244E|nr:DUF1489 domain-containing protein [Methylobacterium sp. NEAU 140]MDP4025935.1 DUF1489 domain-containing protein [Methylobacterium sp. NEAU 140]
MALHLLKLCVGPASIAELEARQARVAVQAREEGRPEAPVHVTRMLPKRHSEIAGRGSLYWVIRGTLCCRQGVATIEPTTGADGVPRCRLVLDPRIVPVAPRPCRPFQGWRYLAAGDAPADLAAGLSGDLAEMPEALRRELAGLGLL